MRQSRIYKMAVKGGKLWEMLIAICAIAGIVLSSVFDWWQIDEFKDASRTDLRAYMVVPRGVRLSLGLIPGQHATVEWQIENVGKTPAYNVRVLAKVLVTDHIQASTFEEIDTISAFLGATLGPGMPHTQTTSTEKALTEDEVGAIGSGSVRLTLIGKIVYVDKFGGVQFTRFQYIYLPWTGFNVGMNFSGAS